MGLIGFGATEEFVLALNQCVHEYGRKNPVYEFSVSISLLTLDIFNCISHTRDALFSDLIFSFSTAEAKCKQCSCKTIHCSGVLEQLYNGWPQVSTIVSLFDVALLTPGHSVHSNLGHYK